MRSSVEVVKQDRESSENGQSAVYKSLHRSHATSGFLCWLRGKTNLSHVDKWFIERMS